MAGDERAAKGSEYCGKGELTAGGGMFKDSPARSEAILSAGVVAGEATGAAHDGGSCGGGGADLVSVPFASSSAKSISEVVFFCSVLTSLLERFLTTFFYRIALNFTAGTGLLALSFFLLDTFFGSSFSSSLSLSPSLLLSSFW